jgi:hypothetical protein
VSIFGEGKRAFPEDKRQFLTENLGFDTKYKILGFLWFLRDKIKFWGFFFRGEWDYCSEESEISIT